MLKFVPDFYESLSETYFIGSSSICKAGIPLNPFKACEWKHGKCRPPCTAVNLKLTQCNGTSGCESFWSTWLLTLGIPATVLSNSVQVNCATVDQPNLPISITNKYNLKIRTGNNREICARLNLFPKMQDVLILVKTLIIGYWNNSMINQLPKNSFTNILYAKMPFNYYFFFSLQRLDRRQALVHQ